MSKQLDWNREKSLSIIQWGLYSNITTSLAETELSRQSINGGAVQNFYVPYNGYIVCVNMQSEGSTEWTAGGLKIKLYKSDSTTSTNLYDSGFIDVTSANKVKKAISNYFEYNYSEKTAIPVIVGDTIYCTIASDASYSGNVDGPIVDVFFQWYR